MVILFYQKKFNRRYSIFDQLQIDKLHAILPRDIDVTFRDNREGMEVSDVVIFDLPFMRTFFRQGIEKPAGQIWVAWCLECDKNYPWMSSGELTGQIDLWMTYRQNSDIVLPYYDASYEDKLLTASEPKEPTKNVCMFISSPVNESKRLDYLSELMRFLPIDSYGSWNNNCRMKEDYGYPSKMQTIRRYKFTIAFENAVGVDYVTEKYFEPLIAGSVPIYYGAPNIGEYEPGVHSMIHVRDYKSPKELAESVLRYCQDEKSYADLLEWKRRPLNENLQHLIEGQKIHPFIRLADLAEKVRRGEYQSSFHF